MAKIHALADRRCWPLTSQATGGQVADCEADAPLLGPLLACCIVPADAGHDSDAIHRQIETTGAAPIVPAEVDRNWKPCLSPVLHRGRNAIKGMFGRFEHLRRVAVCLAAAFGDRIRF